ncbi:hypothetical protein QVD17_29814 [Tagetes erecta]|uniref:O-fucosyltransferase family protein n=1 Tax=Tagetes erecta TaxID=13708 RepID=A0AAD8NFG7_TARER|nr:hypothetical protein QVD17_29814 [Tagetes erecta]
MDVRQILGAILTFSMFVMLGNMIKKEHFDEYVLMDVQVPTHVEHNFTLMMQHSLIHLPSQTIKNHGQRLKLCWNNSSPTKASVPSKGLVMFSLTDGPEYHVSQVANAVSVAKHLGATLVLPEIIGSKGEKRAFDEIYDVNKFVRSMNGVIQVEARKQPETSTQKFIDVKVPYNADQNYIMNNIKPVFQTARNVRVISYLPSSNMRQGDVDKSMNQYSCWAAFEALRLKPELQEAVDSVVTKLRSHDKNGQFVAIDYKSEMMRSSICQSMAYKGIKTCYNPIEIARFFQRIGYPRDSILYVTQSKADHSLRALKDLYPNTLTKEDIMHEAKMTKYVDSKTSELEQAIIDFQVCSVSEVFVPAKSGLFYANVAGNRIANSRPDILVPAQITSNVAQDHVSSYIAKASHPVYACFCK